MSNQIEEYKKIRKSIDIIKTKENFSNEIIQNIRDYNLDYHEVALDLGVTPEKLSTILIQPKNANGSELLLISDNIKKKKITK